ncbi:MAG: GlsB/YeaQ/YmgE family stress response membrane protein [Pirellulales bacterium]|nr:GlsB/YeaQ/YmgE family stress response membrane protein [Pirellulales bacterium]
MAETWANVVLTWIGYGTLVGLIAKAIMPGRDPGGTITTLAMGIGGSVIGCGTLAFFWEGQRVMPISPLGFLVATGGSFFLLLFYRLMAGHYFVEGTDGHFHYRGPHRPRQRTRRSTVYETVGHGEDEH